MNKSTPRKVSGFRNILYASAGNLFPPLSALATAPILAHSLGIVGRGEVAAATAPYSFAVAAIAFGLPDSVTYFIARATHTVGRAVAISLATLFVAGVLGFALVSSFSGLLAGSDPELAKLIIMTTAVLPLGLVLGGIRGVAAGLQWWKLVALERLIGSIFRLVGICLLALTHSLEPYSAVVVIALSNVVGLIVYVRLCIGPRRPQPEAPRVEMRSVWKYGLGAWAGSLAGIMLARLDQLLVVPLAGPAALGLYAVAVNVSEVVLVFNSAVRDVTFAREAEARDPSRLGSAARISTLVTTATAVFVGLASVPMIPILFGAEFKPAVVPTLILLAGAVLGNPGSVAGAALAGWGRPHLRSIALGVALVASTLTLFALAPRFGAVGASVATLVGNVIAGYGNIIWMRAVFGVRMTTFLGVKRADFRAVGAIVRRFQLPSGSTKQRNDRD